MSYFVYNGVSSETMGVRIREKNSYSAPKYDVSMLSIPGRDGELIVQNGRFPNVNISYTCFVPAKSVEDLEQKLTAIKGWLYAATNEYHTLSDSYDKEHFRLGVYHNKLDISDVCRKVGTFTITFNCQPFRYSYAGQNRITSAETARLTNPYAFATKPYIKVNGRGSGHLVIQAAGSNKVWTFETLNGYTECDSEQMNFYQGTILKNDTVEGDGFPTLQPGVNTISFDGGITGIEIIPRWRTL